jgi:hypothetical protein
VTTPSQKLYGPKQILIITISMLLGIGFFLFRRYHETGSLGRVELIAAVCTAIITAVIAVVIIRKGNKEE